MRPSEATSEKTASLFMRKENESATVPSLGTKPEGSRIALCGFAVLVVQRYGGNKAFAIPSLRLTQNETTKVLTINELRKPWAGVLTHEKGLHPCAWDAGRLFNHLCYEWILYSRPSGFGALGLGSSLNHFYLATHFRDGLLHLGQQYGEHTVLHAS